MKALIFSFIVVESCVFRSFSLYFRSLKNKQKNKNYENSWSKKKTITITKATEHKMRTPVYFRAVIFSSISPGEISFKKQELLECPGFYSHCQIHLMPRMQQGGQLAL